MSRKKILFGLLALLYLFGALYLLMLGPIEILFLDIFKIIQGEDNILQKVLFDIRIPKMITTIMAGSSLAICGLLMQTFFRNPLADPFVLGVSSGASLGVIAWISIASSGLFYSISDFAGKSLGTVFFAFLGSFLITNMILALSYRVVGRTTILIIGIIVSFFANSVITIFIGVSDMQEIKSFLLWGQGSFSRVSLIEALVFTCLVFVCLILSMMVAIRLNIFLMGDRYSQMLGVNVRKLKLIVIVLTSLLVGITTGFCGPIAFVGTVSPHIARFLFETNNHKILIPAVFFIGGILTLFSQIFLELININIPFNAIISLVGVPLVFYLLWKKRMIENI